ncbi:helix-turn-helix transcriptional regulator [Streptomyces sp. TS71-3]|uniref:helix-turn-helix transcriptional regulator n=1 Tax=Streptomyces sp. TS71-3 TaxID=2733862 RepID=UPI001B1DB69A|nr:helix-turn-helix transcriptional regulator [Streptomyces sp. TS71-3]GHJ38956.1 transcriptional regulator [Streptomyces sp. TS71-3]
MHTPHDHTPVSAHPKELGAFLRAHRERRRPEDVGLPGTGRRRTPGLRREEVAALSGVGLAWYTWLEQGRVVSSKKVLEAVSRTLGLDTASYRHVLALAGHLPPEGGEAEHGTVARRTQPLLDSWETSPAVLLDCRFDITAWNAAYAAVWSDPALLPASRRNLMWCMVGDPAVRDGLKDWEEVARAVLFHFRAQTARRTEDRRTQEVYAVLNDDFPELSDWWSCQGVDDLTARDVTALLPAGELHLTFSAFRPVDDPEALVLVQAPAGEQDRALVSRRLGERRRRGESTIGGVVRIGARTAMRRVG